MLPTVELLSRLLAAAALGSLVGIERERLLWAAGLRTHMLVCVGACLAMIVSAYGFNRVLSAHVILDPSRIAAQVVTGVGFIGAGSIILRNEVVKGLTTAASLWAVAAIGLAVGGGLYVAAFAATVIILVILAGIKPLEERFRNGRQAVELRLHAEHGAMSVGALQQALGWRAANVRQLVVQASETAGTDDVTVTFGKMPARDIAETIRSLAAIPSVSDVRQAPDLGNA
ncbi:MAG TPA: MgtC/SapB family protein [Caulobacteraceae bacterium]|nr:MgtC/SapB family protein [Caulobacteraceae bacterium]